MVDLSLYSDRILEIAANAPVTPRLAAPTASATKVSKVCGSRITVDLTVHLDTITGYGAEVRACALGQTSAAIVGTRIVGATGSEMRALRDAMAAMLKHGAEPPDGRWADLACLVPVRDYPARHASTLLVFDAVVDALDKAGT